MLPQLSAAVRVFLCTRPTDMRKGFDGLSGLVELMHKEVLKSEVI